MTRNSRCLWNLRDQRPKFVLKSGVQMFNHVSEAVEKVVSKKTEWSQTSMEERIIILKELIAATKEHAEEFHDASFRLRGGIKGNPDHTQIEAHAWAISLLPWSNWLSDILIFSEKTLQEKKVPGPLKIYQRPNGQTACTVGPIDKISALCYGSPTYDVIIKQGAAVEQQDVRTISPKIVAILGAGNFEACIDVLTCLFMENSVCVYKMNPVVESEMSSVLSKVLAPLTSRGYVAVLRGDASVGQQLLHHPMVEKWYMTGSIDTFNTIVWGRKEGPQPGEQEKERKGDGEEKREGDGEEKIEGDGEEKKEGDGEKKREGDGKGRDGMVLDKECIAELGGCSPIILCPDSYMGMDISLQVNNLSVFSMLNGGHVCVRPQCIITDKQWKSRDQFIEKLRSKLQGIISFKSYYPRANERMEFFASLLAQEGYSDFLLEQPHNQFVTYGQQHPFIFATDVKTDSKALQMEAFCPVLLEVPIDVEGVVGSEERTAAFLKEAVRVANNLAGNLTSTIVTKNTESLDVQKAVDELRHGIVGVNVNGVNAITQACLFWGAGRGSSMRDVKSGIGMFGNLYGLRHLEKAVVSSSFYNLALVAQQISLKKGSQPIKLYEKLVKLMLSRNRKIGAGHFLYWSTAIATGYLGF